MSNVFLVIKIRYKVNDEVSLSLVVCVSVCLVLRLNLELSTARE